MAVVQYTFTQNNTQNNTINLRECEPCPVFASYTLAFTLPLRKKHEKTPVRVEVVTLMVTRVSSFSKSRKFILFWNGLERWRESQLHTVSTLRHQTRQKVFSIVHGASFSTLKTHGRFIHFILCSLLYMFRSLFVEWCWWWEWYWCTRRSICSYPWILLL